MRKHFTILALMTLLASYLQHVGFPIMSVAFWGLQLLGGFAISFICEQIFNKKNEEQHEEV